MDHVNGLQVTSDMASQDVIGAVFKSFIEGWEGNYTHKGMRDASWMLRK